ncbi:MAG: (2Fe-2S)-binding protein [Deltaproteobacteria bacterium]|nr:(2Fe-2S)-binding protein [Deltaproteobacteria bacterium]MBW1921140.1 (2Fe-2S)-binding protein [Deltaproteobacteria bacterium]MBW1936456.1 (2Fe-2S)-binding protein [Deltaproteobacteria bacterium]MBW1978874.1 (2Fe-2S)-binding protein [Deltaproteobacteria bacterium]MBW2046252.1 (2Fe-2S)-binding protein [Deltaproteobacteria bacterium]
MNKRKVTFTVNGERHELVVEPNELLLNVLREKLGLTGTKYACGKGQCGACTVLVNGESFLSCLTLAVAVDGAEIRTIEGVAEPDGTLDPIQEAFLDSSAIQCGFCTPGMVLMGRELLNRNPRATEEEIREQIKGNLCRCTGYFSIVRAIKSCCEK